MSCKKSCLKFFTEPAADQAAKEAADKAVADQAAKEAADKAASDEAAKEAADKEGVQVNQRIRHKFDII